MAAALKNLARLVLLGGGVAVGLFLFRASPRDVTLVYDVSGRPEATSLEVQIRRAGEVVRRAEFRLAPAAQAVRHEVRLPDGEYELSLRIGTPSGDATLARRIDVRESGTIVLSLGP